MKRTLISSCLLGAALFFAGCTNTETPGGTPTEGSTTTTSVVSSTTPLGTAAPPSGAPIGAPPSGRPVGPPPSGAPVGPPPSGAPVGPPPSGAPVGPPPSGAPVGAPPSALPAAGLHPADTKIEPLPKPLPETGKQDPAGIVRVYLLSNGSVKPATLTAAPGKPVMVIVNNYQGKEAPVEVSGGSVSEKATVGANAKGGLVLKAPEAGEYKIAAGSGSVTLTVK